MVDHLFGADLSCRNCNMGEEPPATGEGRKPVPGHGRLSTADCKSACAAVFLGTQVQDGQLGAHRPLSLPGNHRLPPKKCMRNAFPKPVQTTREDMDTSEILVNF